ncbi:MAG: ATP-binding protein [Nitrospirae bacterium]|nr:ATP-binding protein [Nitrospirota bacterium]
MAKRNHTGRTAFDFVRTIRQKTSGSVRSLGIGIRQLTSSLQLAAEPDTPRDDMLLHLGNLLDSVTTGIISLDGEGRIVVFNAVAEKLFGLPRVMVIGRNMGEIGKIMGFDDHARRALWERLTDAVWAAGAARDLEHDLLPRTGPRKVISYSVYPLGRRAWSIGNGVVIKLEDITRKREMEDQIFDARKRLLAVFDGITDGIQVVDDDFIITAVNKSMTSLLAREIKIGAHCYEACSFDVKICVNCPAEETFRTGQPVSATKKLLQTGGGTAKRERYVEITTFPLLDRFNRVVQVVEYIKDVTERVRLAERLEHSRRLAELGEMAARVAHEVRNPLNAITGAAHYLSTEYANDETLQKFTDLIKRQATRVNQVASDLLYVSKPLGIRLTAVNINAMLDQSLDALREQLRDQNIEVVRDLDPDIPSIQADELQIEQALHNILRNAVEAMAGGGTLRLSTIPAQGRSIVEIRIEDTGHGIPEHDRERIFQSFFTTKIKGTGLGLTIVQRVLKNHGGEIVIEQPATGGTRVLVQLPVQAMFGVPPIETFEGRLRSETSTSSAESFGVENATGNPITPQSTLNASKLPG